jgi:hypothetical protein
MDEVARQNCTSDQANAMIAEGGALNGTLEGLPAQENVFKPAIEHRMKDPTTGAEKGVKEARFDLIPAGPLFYLARVYGKGSLKYAERNWEAGYKWGWSFGALMRHAWAFWRGEELDRESGLPHLAHAAWHCFTLMDFCARHRAHDDRGVASRISSADATLHEAQTAIHLTVAEITHQDRKIARLEEENRRLREHLSPKPSIVGPSTAPPGALTS